jgi:hypothetical protein
MRRAKRGYENRRQCFYVRRAFDPIEKRRLTSVHILLLFPRCFVFSSCVHRPVEIKPSTGFILHKKHDCKCLLLTNALLLR